MKKVTRCVGLGVLSIGRQCGIEHDSGGAQNNRDNVWAREAGGTRIPGGAQVLEVVRQGRVKGRLTAGQTRLTDRPQDPRLPDILRPNGILFKLYTIISFTMPILVTIVSIL